MECSAKNNQNIKEIFLTFQQLARIPMQDSEGLKRRSSAQARVDSKKKFADTNLLSPSHAIQGHGTGGDFESNIHNSHKNTNDNQSLNAIHSNKLISPRGKPRSRSLIRRSSKKVKNKEDADDCSVQ